MADSDPLDVRGRLYRQVAALLTDLERGDDRSLATRIQKELAAKKTLESLPDRIANELAVESEVTMSERIRALAAIGRLEVIFHALRKADEPVSGGKVRKYASAFRAKTNANAAGRGAARTGPTLVADAGIDPFADADDDDPDTAA